MCSLDPIEIQTEMLEPELTLYLDGETLPGTWLGDDRWVVFEPKSAIWPATTYTWRVRAEEQCAEGSFPTSEVGLPVIVPNGLIGKTFAMNA